VLHTIPYVGKDTDVVSAPDPLIVGSAQAIYERGEKNHTHAPGENLLPPKELSSAAAAGKL